jgi:hypothetical protein
MWGISCETLKILRPNIKGPKRDKSGDAFFYIEEKKIAPSKFVLQKNSKNLPEIKKLEVTIIFQILIM